MRLRTEEKVVERQINISKETGSWLSTLPSTVNGTELSALEFRDRLHLRYNHNPPDMCKKCDGCGEPFTLSHALSCKKGGLIIMRHDEIKDELGDLLSQALTPSAVRDEPSIKPSPTVRNTSPTIQNNNNNLEVVVDQHERRGDLLVRGLWERSKYYVIDVKITDVNQPLYIKRCPKKYWNQQKKVKKQNIWKTA